MNDTLDQGVDLVGIADRALWWFVAQERDYFHAMMGYEPRDRELVHLIRRVSAIPAVDAAHLAMAALRCRPSRACRLGIRTIRPITPRAQRRLSHDLVANPVSA